MERDDLLKKLHGWLPPKPPPLPFTAMGAAIMNFKERLATDPVLQTAARHGEADGVEFLQKQLDATLDWLAMADIFDRRGEHAFDKSQRQYDELVLRAGIKTLFKGQSDPFFKKIYTLSVQDAYSAAIKNQLIPDPMNGVRPAFLKRARGERRMPDLQPQTIGALHELWERVTLTFDQRLSHLGHLPDVEALRREMHIIDNDLMFRRESGLRHGRQSELTPQDGPLSALELRACLKIFAANSHLYNDHWQSDLYPRVAAAKRALAALGETLADLTNDVGPAADAILDDMLDAPTLAFIEKNYIVDGEQLPGFVRFYTEHHKDKLPSDLHLTLTAQAALFHENMLQSIIEARHALAGVKLQDAWMNLIKTVAQMAWRFDAVDYPRPSVDEVAAFHEKKTRQHERFAYLRAARPAGMLEVVTLAAEEDPDLRFQRKKMFGQWTTPEGEEGPKRKFLKDIATNNAVDLQALGLRDTAIAQMRETGALPRNADGVPYDLTIEHIHDRAFGGTNHPHNFILMPGAINAAKNDFIRLQAKAHGGATGWILNWEPVRRADGTYPKVLLTGASLALRPEPAGQPSQTPVQKTDAPSFA